MTNRPNGVAGAMSPNPTVAMVEAAYRHHGLDWRYINCEVAPRDLGDAVRGARAMGWAGFNCSLPHKVAVIEHLDGLGMLVNQGVIGIKYWTGLDVKAEVMRAKLEEIFG